MWLMLWRSTLHATAVDICCCGAYRHQPSRPSRRPSSRATPRSTAPTLGRGSARTCHSLSAVRPRSGRRNCTPSSLQRRWSRARWQVRPKGATRRSTARPVLRAGRAGRVIGHGGARGARGACEGHHTFTVVLGDSYRTACSAGVTVVRAAVVEGEDGTAADCSADDSACRAWRRSSANRS